METGPHGEAIARQGPGEVFHGLTKREYFAVKIMAGMIDSELYFGTVEKPYNPWIWVAGQSLIGADALIAELNKDPK